MRIVKVAAAQYPVDRFDSIDSYEMKLADWIAAARAEGADLVVLPDHAAFEYAGLLPDGGDLAAAVDCIEHVLSEIDALTVTLARRHGVHVVAGSAPQRTADGDLKCVTRLFTPTGPVGRQETLVPSPRERRWGVSGGGAVSLFRTAIGAIAILPSTDVLFPMLARAAAEAGAELLVAPPAPEDRAAAARLRLGAGARALETGAFVIRAAPAAAVSWSPAFPAGGTAGIHAPPEGAFPTDGLVAEGEAGASCFVRASLDLDAVTEIRTEGSSRLFRDWPEQGIVTAPAAEVVDLT